MNLGIVGQGLPTTALNQERVSALLEVGIPAHVIADITHSAPSSVRNWKVGAAEPRALAYERLDDLRSALGQLISAGIHPARAERWLQSRSGPPTFDRPTELIKDGHILEVFKMADGFIASGGGRSAPS